ncbi:MAG: phage holin family protein [Hyphomicrobiales bacterium]
MAKVVLHFLIVVATFLLLAHYVPGFYLAGWGAAVLAALVLGLVNAVLRPFLLLLSLPLLVLSLGLFWFVLNMFLLIVTSFLVPGFDLNGWEPALIGSVVLSAVNLLWSRATKADRGDAGSDR